MHELLEPDRAAAELLVRTLRRMGAVSTAWRKEDTNVVAATTDNEGVHLLNVAEDFDADVHLICETSATETAGNLPDDIDPDDHGSVYFNFKVRGVADDPEGYALPTHLPGRQGAEPRDDLSGHLAHTAACAGLDLD